MKRFAALLLLAAAPQIPAAEFNVGGHTFALPEGYTIELAATSPTVGRPIEADFDEDGRLYVTDSSGSNEKPDKQLETKPNRILRLEDTDGDGRFDKTVVFADKMPFLEGAMFLDGSLYVSAPPSIWKLTDTDGDGVADKREEWFKGGTLTGCANDLHGPYAGPDGWIYWAKGAFAKQTHERPGQPPIVTRASHIFRARPDGSGLEFVMTGGMDNPVGVAFSPEGERFFTCTFIQHPEAGRRDALVHAIYGGVYGKVNDVVDDHIQTGDLMPVMTHLGAAAPCGLLRYEPTTLDDPQNIFFVCNFNMHKITRHVLAPDGSTFKTKDSDFLVAADTDFHPTDILEDADGSILVVDTGGWYKLCCPTSQLAKPDVLGAIYRIRKTGGVGIADPLGKQIDWKGFDLTKLLASRRPFVQRKAMRLLAERGAASVGPLNNLLGSRTATEVEKINAIWTLTRIDSPEARAACRVGLTDRDSKVRVTATHSAAVRLDRGAKEQIRINLTIAPLQERRAIAEALGRFKDPSVVPTILEVSGRPLPKMDRTLEHSLTYALIEISDTNAIRKGLKSTNSEVQKIALTALSQIPSGLAAEEIAPSLTSKGELRKTAEWIAGKHPEWGSALAGIFRTRLAQSDVPNDDRAAIGTLLGRLAGSQGVQELLAQLTSDANADNRLLALRAMSQAGLKKAPDAWLKAVATAIGAQDTNQKRQAIATARALSIPKDARDVNDALRQAAEDEHSPAPLRLAAQRTLPEGKPLPDSIFSLALANISASSPVEARGDAVAALSRAALNDDQLPRLADKMSEIGPMEFARLFDIFEKHPGETVGLRLVSALQKSPVLASLPPGWILQRLAKFPEPVRKAADSLPHGLEGDAASQRAHLQDLASDLKSGDIRRGQAIFNSTKAACISCHSMGYLGGKVGPDLTSIGQVRTEMDLLESIVYPSASFVRSYEPVVVTTKDGETHTGILRGDTDEGVLLVSGPNIEERIARANISEMRLGAVSIMPAGLDTQLNKQELADLVAFLKGTKWGPN